MPKWEKGKIWSPEARLKMSLAKRGKKLSLEQRAKISASLSGKKRPVEVYAKIAKSNTGKKRSLEQINRISQSHKGHIHSIETRRKMSEAHKGEKSPNWKGGITKERIMIRESLEYRLWRESVFKRDSWKCIWCGSKKRIEADHIKPFCDYPELHFAIDNGRTLCHECHIKTPTYGYKSRKYK